MEARSDIDAQIVRYTRFLEAKDKSNHLVADFLNFFCIEAGVEQFFQVKRMIEGIGDVLFSTYFLRQVRTLRGAQTHNTHATTHGEGCI